MAQIYISLDNGDPVSDRLWRWNSKSQIFRFTHNPYNEIVNVCFTNGGNSQYRLDGLVFNSGDCMFENARTRRMLIEVGDGFHIRAGCFVNVKCGNFCYIDLEEHAKIDAGNLCHIITGNCSAIYCGNNCSVNCGELSAIFHGDSCIADTGPNCKLKRH